MIPAPVGFQCPECVAAARTQVRPVTVRSLRRRSSGAPATISLLGLNAAVWLGIILTGAANSKLVQTLALMPTAHCVAGGQEYVEVTRAECASVAGTFFPGVAEGAWWQLLTSAFTHENYLHIGFNMLALWVLGPQLEQFLGLGRYLALYLGSALAGSVAVYWLADPTSTTLGASGAIFGLMGALLVIALRRGGPVQSVVMWIGINIAFTFLAGPAISWQGHLGGLAGGVAMSLLFLGRRRGTAEWAGVAVLVGALLVLAVVRTLALS